MRKLLYITLLFAVISQAAAQQPVISNIDPVSGYPSSRIAISGAGFSTNPADLVVWFGSVKANIISADTKLIQVEVPAQASADNITVINLASGLAVQSDEKFFPVFGGSGFDPLQTQQVSLSSPNHVYDPCSCDLDGDGRNDVISTKFEAATDLTLLHNGSTVETLSFTQSQIPIGFPTVNLRCGDLNGDGKPDLYMSRGGNTRYNVFVLENTSVPGAISFAPMITLPMNTNVTSRRVNHKDLNGDGRPEIVVTNSNAAEVIVFPNSSAGGALTFDAPLTVSVAGANSTAGLDIQDIDGDGKPEIIVCPFMLSNVYVLPNTSTGSISFGPAKELGAMGSMINLTTGDFTGNGKLDIAVLDNASDRVYVFPNTSSPGNIVFGTPYSMLANDGPWGISTGDVDGDGKLDMIATSVGSNGLAVMLNRSSGENLSFTKTSIDLGKRSRNVSVSDLDGDAKPDFIVTAFVSPSTDFDVRLIRNKNCYQPVILNETPLSICASQTITLSTPPSPAVAFSWTRDGAAIGGNSNTLDITGAGLYEVTATSETGACVTTASINVASGSGTVPGNPTAGNNGPACLGGELTLTVNAVAGATYKWTGPNNFTSTLREPLLTGITNDMAGIYSVYIKSGDCQSAVSETIVEVVTMPEFNLNAGGPREVCSGSVVNLTADLRSGYTYQWVKDGADIIGATTNTYAATASGTYSVRIDDLGSNCITSTNEVVVGVYTPPVVDFTFPSTVCSGQEVSFTNNTTVDPAAPVVYNWNFGNGTSSSSLNPAIGYATGGSYTVQLSASYTGVAGCNDSKSKGISVKDPLAPVIQSAETALCPGAELELSIPETYTNIHWSTSETTNSIIVTAPGTYSVNVNDVNGCGAYAEITIGAKDIPNLTVGVIPDPADTVISAGTQVQLEASGAATYSWSPGQSLSDSTISNPTAKPEETTTYTVTGTSADGCSSSARITITVTEEGEPEITPLKAFSPLSTVNPTWYIENIESYPDCTLSIFDERGSVVFRQKGYQNDWDATYNGKNLPEGVYYYVFGCEGLKAKTGSVLVVR